MDDVDPPSGKKRCDEAIILRLATGSFYADAAEVAGCSLSTVRRRMSDTKFRQKVARARAQLLSEASGKLARITGRAVDEIEKLFGSQDEKVRFRAAVATLDNAVKFGAWADAERRLSDIEERLDLALGKEREADGDVDEEDMEEKAQL